MLAYWILTAVSDVSLPSGRDAERAKSLNYIPGSSIMGAMAEGHLKMKPGAGEEFREFFLAGRISFGNAYPADISDSGAGRPLQDTSLPVRSLPLTALSCKRFPGFRYQSAAAQERHGVTDSLLNWTLFALSGELELGVLNGIARCDYHGSRGRCGEPMERLEGFYRRGHARNQIGLAEPRSQFITRVGLNYATGTAHQGILYSREVIPRGSRFWGQLVLDEDMELFSAFERFVRELSVEGLFRLGSNRTRGLGMVSVTELEVMGGDTIQELEARAVSFDRILRETARSAGIPTPDAFYLPLTLLSDAIITDPLGRYRGSIDGEYLAEEWNIAGTRLVFSATAYHRVSGWNSLWGLPREDMLALAMGSVFVLAFAQPPDFALLYQIEGHGVGCRRAEGFGRLAIAEPFHQEVCEL